MSCQRSNFSGQIASQNGTFAFSDRFNPPPSSPLSTIGSHFCTHLQDTPLLKVIRSMPYYSMDHSYFSVNSRSDPISEHDGWWKREQKIYLHGLVHSRKLIRHSVTACTLCTQGFFILTVQILPSRLSSCTEIDPVKCKHILTWNEVLCFVKMTSISLVI